MKITLTRNTIANGRPVEAGATLEVPDADGRYLCEMGKAVPVRAPKRETATVKPRETTAKNKKDGK